MANNSQISSRIAVRWTTANLFCVREKLGVAPCKTNGLTSI
jgi:hypothetical protein